jgi:hypothetical protein
MVRKSNSSRGRALRRACYLTAILSSLVGPAHSQETLSEKTTEGIEPMKFGPFDFLSGIKGSVV